MTDEEREAVESLERLGLSSYEARAFVALCRLGGGTANDVHRASGVPQSRLYGVMEGLQDRGLVDVQASTPKRYRPVGLEAARSVLRRELDDAEREAFDYLERAGAEDPAERGETVWMVHGGEAVSQRVVRLVEDARRRVIFGAARPEQVPAAVADALGDRATAGVRVVAMGDAATAERYPAPVTVADTSAGTPAPSNAARILIVDDDAVLMSTVEPGPDGDQEVGMWTAGTGLGRMLAGVLDGATAGVLDRPGE